MQISQIFVPKTPHFSNKIRSLDPIFGNPPWHIPTKKKLSAPLGQIISFEVLDIQEGSGFIGMNEEFA